MENAKRDAVVSCPMQRAVAPDTSARPEVEQGEKRQKTKSRRDVAAFPVHQETGKVAPMNPTIPVLKSIRSGKWSQEDCVPNMENYPHAGEFWTIHNKRYDL